MIPAITKIYSLYSIVPQVHFVGFLFLKPQTTAAEFGCVPGKNVVLAKKDSKKFVFSTKSLEKISFFFCSQNATMCLVYV